MISFEKLYDLIEEGIYYIGGYPINNLYIDFNDDIPKDTTIVNLNPCVSLFGKNIPDPYRDEEKVDSLYAGYLVNDEPGGNNRTKPLYHIFKKGVKRNGKDISFLDPNFSNTKDYSGLSVLNEPDVLKIEEDAVINYIQQILLNNDRLGNIKFDKIFYPSSKSKHVDNFVNICKKYLNNITTQKIHKRKPKELYKKIISKNIPVSSLIQDDNIYQSLYNIFKYCYKLFDSNIISKTLGHILPSNTTLTNLKKRDTFNKNELKVYKCILLSAFIYKTYTSTYFLSAANDIRVSCNKFTEGWDDGRDNIIENGKTIKLRDAVKQLTGVTPTSYVAGKLDAYLSYYYSDKKINKENIKNILCIDDNINIGSTVFEITRLLKNKYKDCQVHWLVLFMPQQNYDSYFYNYLRKIEYFTSLKQQKHYYEQKNKENELIEANNKKINDDAETEGKRLTEIENENRQKRKENENNIVTNIKELKKAFDEIKNNRDNLKLKYDNYVKIFELLKLKFKHIINIASAKKLEFPKKINQATRNQCYENMNNQLTELIKKLP